MYFFAVTVDYGRDKSADTGGFEVVHQIKMSERRNTIDDISREVAGGPLFGTTDENRIPMVTATA